MSTLLPRALPEALRGRCTVIAWGPHPAALGAAHLANLGGVIETTSCGTKTPFAGGWDRTRLLARERLLIIADPDEPISCINCLQFLRKHYPPGAPAR
jgi:hypothetical protein